MINDDLKEIAIPLAYFITFTCYGTWLHCNENMSVNPYHNQVGMPYLPANRTQEKFARNRMTDQPYLLELPQRNIILNTIKNVCTYRKWTLLAGHVRTNHVHVVVHALTAPEKILNSFKSYCSRELNNLKTERGRHKRWTRHGSTRYLWKSEQVESAIHYVVHEQGEAMAVYEKSDRIVEHPEIG